MYLKLYFVWNRPPHDLHEWVLGNPDRFKVIFIAVFKREKSNRLSNHISRGRYQPEQTLSWSGQIRHENKDEEQHLPLTCWWKLKHEGTL